MNSKKTATTSRPAKPHEDADRKSNFGLTPDPWDMCSRIEYGGDRSFAWTAREQVLGAPPEDRGRIEDLLLKSLAQQETTAAGRAFVCEMLALVGGARSVTALAGLLRQPHSAESARYALQQIPGDEASTVLRDALGNCNGAAKAGLIGSIAARRDSAARPALAALKDNPAEPVIVREAAAQALILLAAA